MEVLSTGNYISFWWSIFTIFFETLMLLLGYGFFKRINIKTRIVSVIICLLIVCFGSIQIKKSKRITYKVVLTDVSYSEMIEEYEVINQDGKIFEIMEKD